MILVIFSIQLTLSCAPTCQFYSMIIWCYFSQDIALACVRSPELLESPLEDAPLVCLHNYFFYYFKTTVDHLYLHLLNLWSFYLFESLGCRAVCALYSLYLVSCFLDSCELVLITQLLLLSFYHISSFALITAVCHILSYPDLPG